MSSGKLKSIEAVYPQVIQPNADESQQVPGYPKSMAAESQHEFEFSLVVCCLYILELAQASLDLRS